VRVARGRVHTPRREYPAGGWRVSGGELLPRGRLACPRSSPRRRDQLLLQGAVRRRGGGSDETNARRPRTRHDGNYGVRVPRYGLLSLGTRRNVAVGGLVRGVRKIHAHVTSGQFGLRRQRWEGGGWVGVVGGGGGGGDAFRPGVTVFGACARGEDLSVRAMRSRAASGDRPGP